MTGFQFAEPEWVHLLWGVLGFVLVLGWLDHRAGGALGRLLSVNRHGRLINRVSLGKRGLRLSFLGLTGVFLIIALMRPQWGVDTVQTARSGAEIMICLDVSNSMLSEDVAPNRLDRAKAEIRDLLAYLDGDQVGLIAFAGRATILSPLTEDFGYLRLSLDSANASSVARGGTRLEEPISRAVGAFGDSTDVSRSILLITDGEDHDSFPLEAAKVAAERGIRILTIGFGDELGSEVFRTDPVSGARDAMRDGDGQVVISRLDGDLLRDIALITDGAYVPAGTDLLDLEAIYARHIAPLTRGERDGRLQYVKKDLFQWAVLLGLLSLVVAAAGTVISIGASSVGNIGPVILLATLLSNLGLFRPALAEESELVAGQDSGVHTIIEPGVDDAPSVTNVEIPDDPRQAYNEGTKKLESGHTQQAITLLNAARDKAGTDERVRYRATYNLGWAEVQQADAIIDTDPAKALESLRRAIDWFQYSVSLRPGEEDARFNLETVMRRLIELEDYLSQNPQSDLQGKLEALISGQRAFLKALGDTVQVNAEMSGPTRGDFRKMAQQALALLGDADAVNEQVVVELEAIKAKSEDELAPAERMRGAQLEKVLAHLHLARERMAQSRTRLRRLQGLRSFQRGSGALESIKQARDQLLNPVARLDGLIEDIRRLTELTVLSELDKQDFSQFTDQRADFPMWITQSYLGDTQRSLLSRTEELHGSMQAGLRYDAPGSEKPLHGEVVSTDEKNTTLLSALRDATPLVRKASDAFRRALDSLDINRGEAAARAQDDGLRQLIRAREFFLDVKSIIELVYGGENEILGVLGEIATGHSTQPQELATLAAKRHSQNVNRMSRLGTMLSDELDSATQAASDAKSPEAQAADRKKQRYEMGFDIWTDAQSAMLTLNESLARLNSEDVDNSVPWTPGEELNVSIESARRAVAHLEKLRHLFFSPVEHLRELAKRQVELNDETQTLAVFSPESYADTHSAEAGLLAPRQSDIKAKAHAIAEGLEKHSRLPSPPNGESGGQTLSNDKRSVLGNAAALVDAAAGMMGRAVMSLEEAPSRVDEATESQRKALEKLIEAIALFDNPESGSESQPQSSSEDAAAAQGRKQSPDQTLDEMNVGQLLQGVRDREASRRRDQSNAVSIGQVAVEKDW